MTTNAEMMERKEEYILRGSAPTTNPERRYETLEDADEALRDAVHDWPQYHHRLVLRVTRVEEIALYTYPPPRKK